MSGKQERIEWWCPSCGHLNEDESDPDAPNTYMCGQCEAEYSHEEVTANQREH